MDGVHQRDAQLAIKKPLGDPTPSGESQEVSSVIGVAINAALQNNLNGSDGCNRYMGCKSPPSRSPKQPITYINPTSSQ
jgi:hypothetical protein